MAKMPPLMMKFAIPVSLWWDKLAESTNRYARFTLRLGLTHMCANALSVVGKRGIVCSVYCLYHYIF